MNTPNKFWMVYVENQSSPTCKHSTEEIAKGEAKRLTKMLGRKAYVLEAVSEFMVVDVIETKLQEPSEYKVIPF